jgi:hypothetical protein
MTYLARTLITKAYYLSSIVSRGFQSVTGEQILDGLDVLNDVLAIKSVDKSLIPYFKEYVMTSVIGQEKYFIPDLITENTVTFQLATNVRQSMQRSSRYDYFGTPRIDNVNALPLKYRIERVIGGSDLYLYFSPSSPYVIKIWGKFGLSEVPSLDTDLSLTYDRYYLTYLRYEVASFLCQENGIDVPPDVERQLEEFESMFRSISPYDFTIQTITAFGKRGPGIWSQASLGKGWTIP